MLRTCFPQFRVVMTFEFLNRRIGVWFQKMARTQIRAHARFTRIRNLRGQCFLLFFGHWHGHERLGNVLSLRVSYDEGARIVSN